METRSRIALRFFTATPPPLLSLQRFTRWKSLSDCFRHGWHIACHFAQATDTREREIKFCALSRKFDGSSGKGGL
jgi:hypothetical protein